MNELRPTGRESRRGPIIIAQGDTRTTCARAQVSPRCDTANSRFGRRKAGEETAFCLCLKLADDADDKRLAAVTLRRRRRRGVNYTGARACRPRRYMQIGSHRWRHQPLHQRCHSSPCALGGPAMCCFYVYPIRKVQIIAYFVCRPLALLCGASSARRRQVAPRTSCRNVDLEQLKLTLDRAHFCSARAPRQYFLGVSKCFRASLKKFLQEGDGRL